MLKWEYEGCDKDQDDEMMNIQLGTAGCRMAHDVFGLCTHIDDESVAPGSFKVKIDADGSVKVLTKGHLQFVSAAKKDLSADESNKNAKEGCGNGAGAGEQGATAEEAEGGGGTGGKPDNGDGRIDDESDKPMDPNEQNEEGGGTDENSAADDDTGTGEDDVNGTYKDGGNPSGEGEVNDGANDAASEDPPIFALVVEAMKEQHSKYGLEPEGLALAWYKSLVMMDARGVQIPADDGVCSGGSTLRVQQYVRDRITGYFFVVCAIYKPLLGFLVDRNDGVVLDDEGPQHTLQLAKTSRMLGGNTGYFDGNEDSILLCMHDKHKFNMVWFSCTRAELPKILELAPRDEDKKHAFSAEDLQNAVDSFKRSWHAVDVQGAEGATVIKEDLLRGVNHFRTLHNRKKPKPYLTESEESEAAKAKAAQKDADQRARAAAKAEADKAKAAAKAAKDAQKKPLRKAADNSKRKRPASIPVDDDDDDDDDGHDRHDDGVSTASSSPAKRQRTTRQPPPPSRTTTWKPTAAPRQQLNPDPAPAAAFATSPPNRRPNAATAGAIPNPSNPQPYLYMPSQLPQQPSQQPKEQPHVRTENSYPCGYTNTQQPACAEHAPHSFHHAHMPQQHAPHGMMHAHPVQGMEQQQQFYNAAFAPHFGASAFAFPSAFPPAFPSAFPPNAQMPMMPGISALQQQMMHAAAYQEMLRCAFSSYSSCAPPTPGAKPPAQEAGAEAYTSPSLAAIKARIVYEGKREKDLQEAQAMHEYMQAKTGVK